MDEVDRKDSARKMIKSFAGWTILVIVAILTVEIGRQFGLQLSLPQATVLVFSILIVGFLGFLGIALLFGYILRKRKMIH